MLDPLMRIVHPEKDDRVCEVADREFPGRKCNCRYGRENPPVDEPLIQDMEAVGYTNEMRDRVRALINL
jgi:hypothetical protein